MNGMDDVPGFFGEIDGNFQQRICNESGVEKGIVLVPFVFIDSLTSKEPFVVEWIINHLLSSDPSQQTILLGCNVLRSPTMKRQ